MPPPVLMIPMPRPEVVRKTPQPMPLVTAAMSLPVLAMILAVAPAAIVIEQPTASDSYAILGAILVSVIALMEARHKGRPFLPSVANFLGSAFAGSSFPTIAYFILVQWGWIHPEKHLWARTWQAWAAAGFISGLNGWWLIHRASALLKSFEAQKSSR